MLYPEITCPYCRAGFGAFKENKGKVTHLDIMWCSDHGLVRDCQQSAFIIENSKSIDCNGNIIFEDSFKEKLNGLRHIFTSNPEDVSKETVSYEDFMILLMECMNWGDLEGENEDYDRDEMEKTNFLPLYESGANLKDVLRKFIKQTL